MQCLVRETATISAKFPPGCNRKPHPLPRLAEMQKQQKVRTRPLLTATISAGAGISCSPKNNRWCEIQAILSEKQQKVRKPKGDTALRTTFSARVNYNK